jgi:hypothetical protein
MIYTAPASSIHPRKAPDHLYAERCDQQPWRLSGFLYSDTQRTADSFSGMSSWPLAILIHILCERQSFASSRFLGAPESGASHIGHHAFLPELYIRDNCMDAARHAALGVFPFADDLPNDFFCSGFVQMVSPGQRRVI